MMQTSLATTLCALFVVFAVTPSAFCQTSPATGGEVSRPQPQAQPIEERVLSADERSCKEFVQKFYDWYWNRFADEANNLNFDLRKEPNVWTVVKHKRSVLSAELYRLLSDEEKQMKATRELGNLDFDPFWGNQDAQGRYLVDEVAVKGDRCKANIPQGSEIVELKKGRSSWVFTNIRYCFFAAPDRRNCPDYDLLGILKR